MIVGAAIGRVNKYPKALSREVAHGAMLSAAFLAAVDGAGAVDWSTISKARKSHQDNRRLQMSHHDVESVKVRITVDGPYMVSGGLPLSRAAIGTNAEGESTTWIYGDTIATSAQYSLCRCGQSANKPFCDGSHLRAGFDGTETAGRRPYLEQAKLMRGPVMSLTDVESLCAFARFCDSNGQVWNLVEQSGDPSAKRQFLTQSCECPSGRLVAWDNATGQAVEPRLELSAVLIEDPAKGCSGPLWLRGGVKVIGADGSAYEVRNRVTLCRCGASRNKPFCDGSHASTGFDDQR